MKKQLRLWIQQLLCWYQAKRKLLMILGVTSFIVGFIVSVIGGYFLKWSWTGLTAQTGPNIQQYQPTKTFWDWLQLLGALAIPIVVGFGTVWFTRQQSEVSDAENTNNQRETALQAYIDKMSDLLLKNHLRKSSEDEEVRQIARIRTLTVLRRLDAERKGNVIQFLQEAGLIEAGFREADPIKAGPIKERKAILKLAKADLSGADLSEADLGKANLIGANLSGANLNEADLSKADLIGANLSGANLSGANLSFADLRGADLSKADLSGAKIAQEQLQKAKSLQGATMPDGSKHP